IIGLLIVIAWWVTAGPRGQALLDELAFMDQRPFFAGAQSFTFIGPTGHAAQYLKQGFSSIYLTFGLATLAGVVVGSFVYNLLFRKVRIEWFVTWSDFFRHVAGGLLMGIGGVLAMGCTVGQGITGMSTLALGSFLTLISIIAGSVATMKYEYYLMMREPG
ncbi:MAG TPA: YeeE/YedE thiosulfate transporter family protein, partial [Gammaproteobacteria bacterium]|nr:YeeE/YedE thiosulfate transporter family protein [Gammaproteobacteria bacterium]